jgi:hypothetical protein
MEKALTHPFFPAIRRMAADLRSAVMLERSEASQGGEGLATNRFVKRVLKKYFFLNTIGFVISVY